MFLYSWSLFLGGETNKMMNGSDKFYDDHVRVSYREGCSGKETLGWDPKVKRKALQRAG